MANLTSNIRPGRSANIQDPTSNIHLGHWPFFVVFILLGILFFTTIRDGHDWGGDFSIYVQEARNLAEHKAFDESSYIPTMESMRSQPAAYPPVPALILAPIYAAAGLNYKAFKTALTISLWLSVPFYYVLGRRRGFPPEVAALTCLVFGLSPLVMTVKQTIGSDSVFLFFAGMTLLVLDEIYRRGWDERYALMAGTATACLLMLCYLTRVTGLALIIGFTGYELRRARGLRRFGVVAIVLTGIAVAVYTKFVFHVDRQYGSQFVFQSGVYAANALEYLRVPVAFWGAVPRLVRYPLSAVTVVLGGIGFLRALSKATIAEFYFVTWVAVLIPYWVNNIRYMLPLLPLVLIYAAEGLLIVAHSLLRPGLPRKAVLVTCGVAVICASAVNMRAIETGPIREGIEKPSFGEVCAFLRRQPANALILSWNPRVFAFYTGKPSALYPQTAAPASFEREILSRGPVFLVFYNHELDRQKLTPYLSQARPTVVFKNQDFQVFAIPKIL
jgi:hypothetical protein